MVNTPPNGGSADEKVTIHRVEQTASLVALVPLLWWVHHCHHFSTSEQRVLHTGADDFQLIPRFQIPLPVKLSRTCINTNQETEYLIVSEVLSFAQYANYNVTY